MKKRIVAWLLMLVMIFMSSGVVYAVDDSTAENMPIDNFDLDVYRADIYTKSGSVCNNAIEYLLRLEFPTERLVNQLNAKDTFQNSVTAWKAAHLVTDPSKLADGYLDEKGYYEAIIFSVFLSQQTDENCLVDIGNQITAETNSLISNINNWVKLSDDIEINGSIQNLKINDLSQDTQEMIKDYLEQRYLEKHPALDNVSSISSGLNAFFSTADTLSDALENMTAYLQMTEISNEMKATIQAMYEQCPNSNPILKEALLETVTAMDSTEMALNSTIFDVAADGITKVASGALSDFWNMAVSQCPYAKAFMEGAKIGTFIGDTITSTLFSTDKTIEQYEKMKCLVEFTEILKCVVKEFDDVYTNSRNSVNARNYFASIDAMYKAVDLSCEFAKSYGEIIYEDAALGWLAIDSETYEEYIGNINSIQEIETNEKETLVTLFIANLENDYPDIYQILFGEPDTTVPVIGIHFEKSSVEWGMEDDPRLFGQAAVVEPENASNKTVIYTSSDEDVLSIPDENKLLVSLHKAGIVTITAKTEEGDYEASMKVYIVEGHGKSGNYLEPVDIDIKKPEKDSYFTKGNFVFKVKSDSEVWIYKGVPDSKGHIEILEKVSFGQYEYNVTGIENGRYNRTATQGAFTDGCSYTLRNNKLKSITIPETIRYIGNYAFIYCTGLNKVEIPYGTSIGSDIFVWTNGTLICHEDSFAANVMIKNSSYYSSHDCRYKIVEHTYESELTKKPTWLESGVMTYTCTVCGYQKTEEIPMDPEKVILNYDVQLENDSYMYTGSSIRPKVIVKGLTEGTDYTVEYSDNVNVGTATATITGVGNYEGVVTRTFKIYGKNVDTTNISLSTDTYRYSGMAYEPVVFATDNGKLLKEDEDYEIAYADNIKVGKGTVIVNGKGNYAGTVEKEFEIVKSSVKQTGVTEEGVKWALYDDGKLFIWGKGAAKFPEEWEYKDEVRELSFYEGAINISDESFIRYNNLGKVQFNDFVNEIGEFAFYGCEQLSKVNLSKSIETIKTRAFCNCKCLAQIDIDDENPYFSVNDGILYDKKQTKLIYCPTGKVGTVSIPDSVIEIEDWTTAFNECDRITDIITGDGLTSIPERTFEGCDEIKNVTFGKGIVEIGRRAFNCNLDTIRFTSLEIPEMDPSAFEGIIVRAYYPDTWTELPENEEYGGYLIWLKDGDTYSDNTCIANGECGGYSEDKVNWTISAGGTLAISGTGYMKNYSYATSMPWYKFRYSIEKVIVEGGVTYVSGSAFSDLPYLLEAILSEGVYELQGNVFANDIRLEKITIPKSLISIAAHSSGQKAKDNFKNTPWLEAQGKFVIINGILLAYQGTDENVIIPSEVTTIASDAFNGNTYIQNVTIPSTCSSIGSRAFKDCINLKEINCTHDVDVRYQAFNNTAWLANNKGFVIINKNLFDYEGSESVIVIPADVEQIKSNAFDYDKSITQVTIPENVTVIESNAFRNCQNLKKVIMRYGITEIGSYAFSECENLVQVEIPKSVTVIGWKAFSETKWLEQNTGLLIAGSKLLRYEGEYSEIVIPDTVEEMEPEVFQYSSDLEHVTISGSVNSISAEAFWECNNLKRVDILEGVESIESYAFGSCDSLSEVVIPKSVKNIDQYAFLFSSKPITIYGYKNSAAEEFVEMYSEEYAISFVPLEEDTMIGDLNTDGNINIVDLMMSLHHVSGRTVLEGNALTAADINDDGKVTVVDLMRLLHYVSGRSKTL